MEYPKRFYIYYAIILHLYLSLKTLRWVFKINLISSQFTHICLLHIYAHAHSICRFIEQFSSFKIKIRYKKKFFRPQ